MMMRGTKRKIEIEKRETKQQRSVACSKRRKTVFSKAADLCRLSGANIAVFVTSPVEDSDVVYSFSGYSSASEIADCYLNGKLPPKTTKLGFWWQDPDLYRCCDDLSEINIIEDRLESMKKDLMACLEKKQTPQVVSCFDQNPNSTSSLDETFHCGSSSSSSSSQIVSNFHPNPSTSSDSHASNSLSDITNSRFASFGQDPNYSSSLDEICGGSSSQIDQNPSFWENLFNDHEFGLNNDLWETKDEKNNSMSLTQETQTEPAVNVGGYDDERSFWENLFNDHEFGLNNDFRLEDNNALANTTNQEDGCMIDISEFLNEEEIGLLQFGQFIA